MNKQVKAAFRKHIAQQLKGLGAQLLVVIATSPLWFPVLVCHLIAKAARYAYYQRHFAAARKYVGNHANAAVLWADSVVYGCRDTKQAAVDTVENVLAELQHERAVTYCANQAHEDARKVATAAYEAAYNLHVDAVTRKRVELTDKIIDAGTILRQAQALQV